MFDDLSERPLVAAPHRKGPVVLEPVTATIELTIEVPVEQTTDGCRIVLDGAQHRTLYYVVEFEAR